MLDSSPQKSIIIWLLSSTVQPGPNSGTVGLSRAVQPCPALFQFTDEVSLSEMGSGMSGSGDQKSKHKWCGVRSMRWMGTYENQDDVRTKEYLNIVGTEGNELSRK